MKKILFSLLGAAMMTVAWSQEQLQLTLDRTITMAQQQSPSAVAAQASLYFFELATAQTNVDIARSNLASAVRTLRSTRLSMDLKLEIG